MPPLISGRNIDKALKDFDPKELGAAAQQAMPAASVSAPAAGAGLIETEDPYEALLNPATHLTQGFEAGDMSQIPEGNASGRDAAMIRPYTAEARSADSMLTSPAGGGTGCSYSAAHSFGGGYEAAGQGRKWRGR
jgi:hypothetical protein